MIARLWREESPGSRKQGVRRKVERVTASQSHRNYVGQLTLKVVGTSEKGQSSPLQPPKGSFEVAFPRPKV